MERPAPIPGLFNCIYPPARQTLRLFSPQSQQIS